MKKVEKVEKVLTVIMTVIMLVTICTNIFAATSIDPSSIQSTTNKIDTKDLKDWMSSIINVIATVGSGAAIITLIVLGIKYMLGSAEEKAEYKKTLLPYIIGAVFVFGASALTGIIYNAVKTSTP